MTPVTSDLSTISGAWSPKILGHHQFQSTTQILNQTLQTTPPTVEQMLSYLDYLDEIREKNHNHYDIFDFEDPI